MKREQLGSRMGFIMLSAGCAIGCGNVWKFPWMCGQNGGGSFMLVYLLCLIILGIPALTMEFSIGRAAQTSPLYMYRKLEKPGQKWDIFGWFCLVGNIALMAFYTVVCGWLIYYFYKFVIGQNQSLGFVSMISDPTVNVTFLFVTVAVAFVILSFHLQGGLERITKIMASIFSQTPRTVDIAANIMNRKNSVPHRRPPAILLNTVAIVSNRRLGPAVTSRS